MSSKDLIRCKCHTVNGYLKARFPEETIQTITIENVL